MTLILDNTQYSFMQAMLYIMSYYFMSDSLIQSQT